MYMHGSEDRRKIQEIKARRERESPPNTKSSTYIALHARRGRKERDTLLFSSYKANDSSSTAPYPAYLGLA
jgi:hypothetical protein